MIPELGKLEEQNPNYGRHLSRLARIAILILVITAVFQLVTGSVLAQSDGDGGGSEAASAASEVCGTGVGDAISFGLGLLVVYLIVKTVFRGASAFDKMGSTRSDEKYEGKQQLVGAFQTLAGAFAIPIFGVLLSESGLPVLSCVDFAGIIYTMPMPYRPLVTVPTIVLALL